jgi:SAM-dependent methyltransferase
LAKYQSAEESWEQHRDFIFDTEEEGKYYRWHYGFGRVRGIMERVPMGAKVLEMGCNSGGLSMLLIRERSCFCYGVDVAPEMVMRALNKGMVANVGPAEKTEHEDGYFDVVVASELLEHVFDPDAVLKEAVRVLRSGGKFVGSVPHRLSVNTRKGRVEVHHYHCRIWNGRSLRKKLGEYFSDIEIIEVPYQKPPQKNVITHDAPTRRAITAQSPQWYVFSGVKA